MNFYNVVAEGMDQDIPDPEEFNKIANYLNVPLVEPEEIIETGLTVDSHLGNIHMSILLNNISQVLQFRGYQDVSIYINAMDTHLVIGSNEIHCLDDILNIEN